jgi:DNA-binding NarL/FixJ family response regulator
MQVLIVDDHPVVIAGCRAILASDSDISIIAASDAKTAVALYESERPDVVVVDLNLRSSISGFELIETILASDPAARIIVLTMAYDPVHALRVIESGAKAYVGKTEDPERFLTAVRTVADGHRFVGADMAQKLAFFDRGGRMERINELTAREREILCLLYAGKNMMEIANIIEMSYKTVANACATLKRKLGARSLTDLTRIALENKLT